MGSGMRAGLGALIFWVSLPAIAVICPPSIEYLNGAKLKQDDRYFYSDGAPLLVGERVYYDNGVSFKNGNAFYYSNGTALTRDNTIYYPNGNLLRRGDRFYYANGNTLKNGEVFYYRNGNVARRGGKLYRPDGTLTPFPLRIEEPVGTVGDILVDIEGMKERIDLGFSNLMQISKGVKLVGVWDEATFTQIDLTLQTGAAHEEVHVQVSAGGVQCDLGGSGGGDKFKLFTPAANLNVTVNPGYNANKVRAALEKALQDLAP